MPSSKTRSLAGAMLSALALAILVTTAPPASAEQIITVKADQAKVLPVQGDPAAVVVGNPLFADVSVRDGMVVVHGRHFGTTNVLVLDQDGNALLDFEVNVVRGGSRNVTMYKAGTTYSYLCDPGCESTLQVGDNPDYFSQLNTHIGSKYGLSTGATKDAP